MHDFSLPQMQNQAIFDLGLEKHVRRQSTRFISQKRESTEDLFQIEKVKIQIQHNLEYLKQVLDSPAPDLLTIKIQQKIASQNQHLE